jgi:VanZ family protein
MKLAHELESVDPMKAAFAARVRTLSSVILVCYWLAMLTGTHWPNFRLEAYPENTDKVLHLSGYAGLTFLIALRLSLKSSSDPAEPLRLNPITLRQSLWILAVIVAYSIFDELTQPYFGRTCDFRDALADWAGGILGLAAFSIVRITLRGLTGNGPRKA